MRTLTLFFLVSTLLYADEQVEDTCYWGKEIKNDHYIYAILDSINWEKLAITLCVLDTPGYSKVEVVLYKNRWVITVSDYTLHTFSQRALAGALAHELGHIHKNYGRALLNDTEREYGEQEADAFAITRVGPDILLETYIAHTGGDKKLAERRVRRALTRIKKYK